MLDGLSISGLHSYYGEAHVLHGVSLEVERRKVVALLGRNGMGKSTLIRSVIGLQPPAVHDGEILYRGESLRGLSPHRIAQKRIGLLDQEEFVRFRVARQGHVLGTLGTDPDGARGALGARTPRA